MKLQWREQLSVGNDLIDSDHQYLIDIINVAGNALETKDRQALAEALNGLSKYSTRHFALEEQIAEAVGYEQTDSLHTSHEALLVRLEQMRQALSHDWDAAAAEHFGALLRDWLISHVIKEDMLMKPALKKFSPRFDPR